MILEHKRCQTYLQSTYEFTDLAWGGCFYCKLFSQSILKIALSYVRREIQQWQYIPSNQQNPVSIESHHKKKQKKLASVKSYFVYTAQRHCYAYYVCVYNHKSLYQLNKNLQMLLSFQNWRVSSTLMLAFSLTLVCVKQNESKNANSQSSHHQKCHFSKIKMFVVDLLMERDWRGSLWLNLISISN